MSANVNYYEILGVTPQATPEEVKNSFRRLVKEYHPDRNRHREAWAGERVRLILEAYRTLKDAQKRRLYDEMHRQRPVQTPKPDEPRRKPLTVSERTEMILLDLIAGNGAAAVAAYEQLCREYADYSLLSYLSMRDYLDCAFLLGEEYERQGQSERALHFYEEVYNEEKAEPRRRYFLQEVRERLRNLYCRHLAPAAPPMVALGYYRRLLQLGLGRAQDAFFHKKMAECHWRMGNYEEARAMLHQAFVLKPTLKGVRKICLKLGMSPPNTTSRQR